MESTGVYVRAVFNVLEDDDMNLLLVNPQRMPAGPGEKTDVKDAEWIADLLRHDCCSRVLSLPRRFEQCVS